MTPHDLNCVFNDYKINAVRYSTRISGILRTQNISGSDDLARIVNERLKANMLSRVIIGDRSIKVDSLTQLSYVFMMCCYFAGFVASQMECYNYIYKVFVDDSWLGFIREKKCAELLKPEYPTARLSDADEDTKYAVDIVVPDKFGVQLKPESYKRFNMQADLNKSKNDRYGLPVYYVYYNYKGDFDFSELPSF
jgi:hypothetical protein